MMFNQILVIIIITLFCVCYFRYTLLYHEYCQNSKLTGDYLIEDGLKKEVYIDLCERLHREYTNHTLLNRTINKSYEYILKREINIEKIKAIIEETSRETIEISLKFLILIHFVFYGTIIYFIIMILPMLAIKLFKYLLSRILVVVLVLFICESFLIIFFGINTDFTKMIESGILKENIVFVFLKDCLNWLIKKLIR